MRFDCIHCRKATTKPQSVKGAFLRMLTNIGYGHKNTKNQGWNLTGFTECLHSNYPILFFDLYDRGECRIFAFLVNLENGCCMWSYCNLGNYDGGSGDEDIG